MKAIRVDFAPRKFRKSVVTTLWFCLSAAVLALTAQQAWSAWSTYQKLQAVRAELGQLRLEIDEAARQRLEGETRTRMPPSYAKDAALMAKMAGFSLEQVLHALESVKVPGVKVSKLDVSAAERVATAELEVADSAALMKVLDLLNAGEQSPRWQLLRAQGTVQSGVAGTATIVSRWE